MNTSAQKAGVESHLIRMMERFQTVSYYTHSRGWGFVVTWAHRVAGLTLVLYMFFHIFTLSGLYEPAAFASKMKLFGNVLFSFLEWALAFPVIFHGLNGTRLILYEIFRSRNDSLMMRWVCLLSALYVVTLGLFMVMGNQQVSAGFFWLTVALASTILGVIVYKKLWQTQNATLWKLQRVSGALLLPMVSGHMFFMHLNYQVGHDVETILARMSGAGMKLVDLVFVVSVFFHAGFGLYTIIGDYVGDPRLKAGLSVLMSFVMAIFAFAGAKLVFSI
jgi:succinate dehydrogenase / fumarate reductase cytochrome b subunit